jgi:hypothetical protein
LLGFGQNAEVLRFAQDFGSRPETPACASSLKRSDKNNDGIESISALNNRGQQLQ